MWKALNEWLNLLYVLQSRQAVIMTFADEQLFLRLTKVRTHAPMWDAGLLAIPGCAAALYAPRDANAHVFRLIEARAAQTIYLRRSDERAIELPPKTRCLRVDGMRLPELTKAISACLCNGPCAISG